jgi:hypothetical protein
MLGPAVFLLLLPTLAVLALRRFTGSPHEQIELNRQVRSSLERSVVNCHRIDLSLGDRSSGGIISDVLETEHRSCLERGKLVAELQELRARLQDRHEQFGNMTVSQLRVNLKEIHALELGSLHLLDTAHHQSRPALASMSDTVQRANTQASTIRLYPTASREAHVTMRPIG